MAYDASTQKNFLFTMTVNGKPILQPATAGNGGGISIDSTKVYPGAMAAQVSLGGIASRENVTVTYHYTALIRSLYKWLDAQAQTGNATVSITRVPLGKDGKPIDGAMTFTGTVENLGVPEYSSDSNDVATVEIECAVDVAVA